MRITRTGQTTSGWRPWLGKNASWAVPAALTLLVAMGGGAWKVWTWWSDRSVQAAEQVRACQKQHGLSKPHDFQQHNYSSKHYRRTGIFAKRLFLACEWPPPDYAEPDGYSEIMVLVEDGPFFDEASGANTLDRIQPTCEEVEVSYSIGAQGEYEHLKPYKVQVGDVVEAYNGKTWNGPAPFDYPGRDEVVVLRNSKIGLDSVRCV